MAGKLSGGGVKGLVLAHCEKAVIGIAVLAAAYLVWQSSQVESYDREPSQLDSAVSTTRSSYSDSTWNEAPEEEKSVAVPVPSPRFGGDGLFSQVLGKLERGLDSPVLPPIVDREDPKLLPPTEITATATTAIFAFIDKERQKEIELDLLRQAQEKELQRKRDRDSGADLTGGAISDRDQLRDEQGRKRRPVEGRAARSGVPTQGYERFELMSAACVLAKAPILEQDKLYRSALLDAQGYDPGRDTPQYYGLYAQRAEVRGDGNELEWVDVRFGALNDPMKARKALSARAAGRMINDWLPWPQVIADQRFVHPILTMPLAPLVKQDWGIDTVHPDAPTAAETQAKSELEAAEEPEEVERSPDEEEFDGGYEDGGRGLAGRGGARGFGGASFGGPAGGGFGGGFGAPPGGDFGSGFSPGASGRRSFGGSGEYEIDPEVPFAMVRFWDFGVAPGRQYRYRIKLVLFDVNRTPEVKGFLSPEVTKRLDGARSRYVSTEWSEPGPVVSIPLAGDAFIVTSKAPRRGAYTEGELELLVQSYSLDDGKAIKAAVRKKFRRGAVLNFEEDAEFISPDGRWIVEADDFEFKTGLTVADFRGGEDLPGKLTQPTRTLMMGPTGKLFVRDEVSDYDAVQAHLSTFEEADPRGGGGFGGGGFGGEFGGEFGPGF